MVLSPGSRECIYDSVIGLIPKIFVCSQVLQAWPVSHEPLRRWTAGCSFANVFFFFLFKQGRITSDLMNIPLHLPSAISHKVGSFQWKVFDDIRPQRIRNEEEEWMLRYQVGRLPLPKNLPTSLTELSPVSEQPRPNPNSRFSFCEGGSE